MKEIDTIKQVGDSVGYGHLMCIASALWRKSLQQQDYPVSGAFVPTITELMTEEGKLIEKDQSELYDEIISNHFNK